MKLIIYKSSCERRKLRLRHVGGEMIEIMRVLLDSVINLWIHCSGTCFVRKPISPLQEHNHLLVHHHSHLHLVVWVEEHKEEEAYLDPQNEPSRQQAYQGTHLSSVSARVDYCNWTTAMVS